MIFVVVARWIVEAKLEFLVNDEGGERNVGCDEYEKDNLALRN